jgi:hypothetical protein
MSAATAERFKVGDRVQTHPATDAWMRGDRYGTVVEAAAANDPAGRAFKVKLDKSGRSTWFHAGNLLPVAP